METIGQVTKKLVKEYGIPKWFQGEPHGRAYAWDIIRYLNRSVPKDAKILEMGCGIGQNLVELWNHGFKDLYGVENDVNTHRACEELFKHFGVEANVGCWNAQDNCPRTWVDFDIIAPLNFTYREEINMVGFLSHAREMLKTGGLLIIDIISSTLPKKKALEYYHRFTEKKFVAVAKDYNLKEVWHDYFPRSVYLMEAI